MSISRRDFTGMLAADAATVLIHAGGQAAAAARNVVLLHGLYADGSCWLDVVARLQGDGINVISVQNPLTTLARIARSTRV